MAGEITYASYRVKTLDQINDIKRQANPYPSPITQGITNLEMNTLTMTAIEVPFVSDSNQGRIYFDNVDLKFKVSENGGAYTDLLAAAGGFWSQNSNDDIYNTNAGYVGIGTQEPRAGLHVVGSMQIRNYTDPQGYIAIHQGDTNKAGYIRWHKNNTTALGYMGWDDGGAGNIGMYLESSAAFVINNGRVGIGTGTDTVGSTLTVQRNQAGGRGPELSLYNGSAASTSNEVAINMQACVGSYSSNDSYARIKAIVTNATSLAHDLVFYASWDGDLSTGERLRVNAGGKIGIGGVTNPSMSINFPAVTSNTDGTVGITWYQDAPTSYGIYQTAGAWTGPNYTQLKMKWEQGIIIEVGNDTAQSYVSLQPTGGNVGVRYNGLKPTQTFAVNGTGYFEDDLLLNENVGSPVYVSGFAGSGWRLEQESGGDNPTLTLDHLYVRKSMTVYELIINKIRATNGSLWVSDAVELESVTDNGGGSYTCYVNTGVGFGQTFAVNDIVRSQIWLGRTVKYYSGQVTAIDAGGEYFVVSIIDGAGVPEAKDTVVRIGNASNAARQGSIYITASDSNNPYIDVLDGVTSYSFTGKTKVRLGKLTGITDANFGGALSGYGLYSNNVYLNGVMVIASGSSGYGNMTDKPTSLSDINGTEGTKLTGIEAGATVGADWDVNLDNVPSTLGAPSGTGLFLTSTYMGFYTSSAWSVYIDNGGNFVLGDIAGGNTGLSWSQSGATLTIKGAITATSGIIGGWTINSTYLVKDTGTNSTSAGIAPSDYPFYAGATYANRSSATFRVTTAGALYATSGNIGGWIINSSYLASATEGQRTVLDAGNSNITMYSGGAWGDSEYLFMGFESEEVPQIIMTKGSPDFSTTITPKYLDIQNIYYTQNYGPSYFRVDHGLGGTFSLQVYMANLPSGSAPSQSHRVWKDSGYLRITD